MDLIKAFFAYLGGVFADPNDKQGSTKRLCLFLFLGTVMLLIVAVTMKEMKLPVIPDSILNLVYFVVTILTGSIVADKGIAAYKAINGGGENAADAADK